MIEQIRASFASLVVVALCSGAAQAAVTITAEEIGGDVVFSTCGGSLNLSGLTKSADTSGGGYIAPQGCVMLHMIQHLAKITDAGRSQGLDGTC